MGEALAGYIINRTLKLMLVFLCLGLLAGALVQCISDHITSPTEARTLTTDTVRADTCQPVPYCIDPRPKAP
jgi:hypothetical protein